MLAYSFFSLSTYAVGLEKVDDWDQNMTQTKKKQVRIHQRQDEKNRRKELRKKYPNARFYINASRRNIGLSVGGAKDIDNFLSNIKHGYIPKMDSLTYEGIFYQHFFDTGIKQECKSLFCPSYSHAIKKDIYTDEKYYYLSVGLNSGIKESDFKRKKLNLVVVLDISGSMGATFNRYYYDTHTNAPQIDDNKSKMQIASESLVGMMNHLKDDDRFGVVLFDSTVNPVKPLRKVKKTDMGAIKKHILDLHEKGGTNWSAGYREAMHYFDGIKPEEGVENRIIFITDAMPNSGELRKYRLFGMVKSASKKGINTTFIGVGVDFNTNLVHYVSKVRGANYYSVHSSSEFKKRMDKEFEFMVTPLVYDLELKVTSRGYKIDAVYGSPDANLTTGSIMKVNTLFPSASTEDKVKGGIVLLRLKKTGSSEDIKLSVKYKDIHGKQYNNIQRTHFDRSTPFYNNNGIRKAILLSEYVTLVKNWMLDERAGCNDSVKYHYTKVTTIKKHCMVYPPMRSCYHQINTWERKSCKLYVSDGYHKIFSLFKRHYESDQKVLKDKSLSMELKVLDRLIKAKEESIYNKLHGSVENWRK